jgi:uncharacterized protein YbaR (Trm112 family)
MTNNTYNVFCCPIHKDFILTQIEKDPLITKKKKAKNFRLGILYAESPFEIPLYCEKCEKWYYVAECIKK